MFPWGFFFMRDNSQGVGVGPALDRLNDSLDSCKEALDSENAALGGLNTSFASLNDSLDSCNSELDNLNNALDLLAKVCNDGKKRMDELKAKHQQQAEERRFNDKKHELDLAMQDEQQAQLVLQQYGLEAYESVKRWQAFKRQIPASSAQYMKELFRETNNSFHDPWI
jgi:chromosome segregation ATPase